MSIKTIPCCICGKEFINLGYHVKAHKMTANEYRQQFEYLSYYDYLVEKINKLFICNRDKWLFYYYDYKKNEPSIKTNNANKTDGKNPYLDRSLNDKDIRTHLKGKNPIGIIDKKISRYICFDIDIKKDIEITSEEALCAARDTARKVIEELTRYIPYEDIHLEFSGGKGYHVWVFFNPPQYITDLVLFGKHIRQFNESNSVVNIELRPESEGGKGIKLPLGIHYKTGKFCAFLHKETFEPVKDSFEYLLNIEPINPINFQQFWQLETKEKVTKETVNIKPISHAPLIVSTKEELQYIWENGLPSQGVRNQYTFLLAILLKDSGYFEEEVKEMLYWFTDREYEAKRTKDNLEKSKKDIDSTVTNVFKHNYHLKNNSLTEFELQSKRQAIPTYKATFDCEIIVSRNALEEYLWQDFRCMLGRNYSNPLNPVA